MSDIFKKIGKTVTETGRSVGEKTKQMGSVAKLNGKITASEHSIEENYRIIGKYYYDTYKNDPDAEIAEKVNAITASIDAIAEMKDQILAVKGLVKCVNCGAECSIESDFCGKCGAKLVKPEPPVVEAEEAAEPAESEVSETNTEE